jgi:hypothetical protein
VLAGEGKAFQVSASCMDVLQSRIIPELTGESGAHTRQQ